MEGGDSIRLEEARTQVQTLARRLAMLHYHYASVIIERMGEDEGRRLVAEAIRRYGTEVGARHRARIVAAGYEPSVENYGKLHDVPPLFNLPASAAGEGPACPVARYFREIGEEEIGRMYCYVDQAKYEAFDPECECRHSRNALDGDPACDIVAKKKRDW